MKATMEKLMHWEMNFHQSTPNCSVISVTGLLAARKVRRVMEKWAEETSGAGLVEPAPHQVELLAEEQGEEHDAFCEGGAQNGLDQDLRGRAGIAPDRFRSLHTDQTDADGRAEGAKATLDAASDLCERSDDAHLMFPVCLLVPSRPR